MQIKIATDSPTQRRILENCLRKLGLGPVQTYPSGQELLDDAQSGNTKLIILSKQLPDMTGLDCTRKLHNQQERGGKFIPVLLAGSEFTKAQVIEAIQTGVSQLIVTPIIAGELGKKVEAIQSAFNSAA